MAEKVVVELITCASSVSRSRLHHVAIVPYLDSIRVQAKPAFLSL
jgi:hypothetical protein